MSKESEKGIENILRQLEQERKTKTTSKNFGDEEKKVDDAFELGDKGGFFIETGQYQKAIELLKRSTEINPDLAINWDRLGCAYEKKDLIKEAIAAFVEAVALDRNNTHYLNNLGIAYVRDNQYYKAIDIFNKAVGINPTDASLWCGLGCAYDQSKQYNHAIIAFKRAIGLQPSNSNYWSGLGGAYQCIGQHQDAKESYKTALQLNPDDSMASINLKCLGG